MFELFGIDGKKHALAGVVCHTERPLPKLLDYDGKLYVLDDMLWYVEANVHPVVFADDAFAA
jgi:hypothetical protein